MKYSIIVCSYNSAKTLSNCLQSIECQTYKDYEVIFIDDGSNDCTKEIIKKSPIYNKIKYFYQKNSGIAVARNKGIKKASGKYLLFLDADDTINPYLLQKINEYLEKFTCDIIRYNANRIEKGRASQKKYFLESFKPMKGTKAILYFIKSNITYGPLWLYCYRRSFLNKLQIFFKPGTIHEDFLNCLWLAKAKSVGGIEYIGYNYYKHSLSLTDPKQAHMVHQRFTDILYYYDYVIKKFMVLYKKDNTEKKVVIKSAIGFLINNLKYFSGSLQKRMLKEIKKRDFYNNFKGYKNDSGI